MYKQFTKETRIELTSLIRERHSPKECANNLGMDKSSITRELARYTDHDGIYRGTSAHKKYLAVRKKAKSASRKIECDKKLRTHIRKRLKKHDSPEQISGRIDREKSYKNISHESIYQWIFKEEPKMKKFLRRISKKGKYRRRRGTKRREKQRDEVKIRRINERPTIVETRERIGDFEGDTIIGKDRKKRLLTNVDRKSGYGMIDKLDVVADDIVHDMLTKRFARIPKNKRYTYGTRTSSPH